MFFFEGSPNSYEFKSVGIGDGKYKNMIFKVDMNLNEKFRNLEKIKLLDYEGDKMPTFKKSTIKSEDSLLKKIKLYSVFS